MKAKILVTGAAGFIGFHLSKLLLNRGDPVLGIDNLNAYYDVRLKEDRLAQLQQHPDFEFQKLDLADQAGMAALFGNHRFEKVVHLAAKAGVRYSLVNPRAYVDSNLIGFTHVLEGCRHVEVRHLVYASSSSVYGANTRMPFSVSHNVDHPVSFYGATKKANELMAHAYAWLYRIPCTGLRFFTVYGPWGRPDMALFLFTKAILEGEPLSLYNYGEMKRDFTYIDDIVEGIVRTLDRAPEGNPNWRSDQPDPRSSAAPYRVYNIGNHNPVSLAYFVEVIEKCLGKKARKNLLPLQPGDVTETYADVDDLMTDVRFKPDTPIEVGVARFVDWYRKYYQIAI